MKEQALGLVQFSKKKKVRGESFIFLTKSIGCGVGSGMMVEVWGHLNCLLWSGKYQFKTLSSKSNINLYNKYQHLIHPTNEDDVVFHESCKLDPVLDHHLLGLFYLFKL